MRPPPYLFRSPAGSVGVADEDEGGPVVRVARTAASVAVAHLRLRHPRRSAAAAGRLPRSTPAGRRRGQLATPPPGSGPAATPWPPAAPPPWAAAPSAPRACPAGSGRSASSAAPWRCRPPSTGSRTRCGCRPAAAPARSRRSPRRPRTCPGPSRRPTASPARRPASSCAAPRRRSAGRRRPAGLLRQLLVGVGQVVAGQDQRRAAAGRGRPARRAWPGAGSGSSLQLARAGQAVQALLAGLGVGQQAHRPALRRRTAGAGPRPRRGCRAAAPDAVVGAAGQGQLLLRPGGARPAPWGPARGPAPRPACPARPAAVSGLAVAPDGQLRPPCSALAWAAMALVRSSRLVSSVSA